MGLSFPSVFAPFSPPPGFSLRRDPASRIMRAGACAPAPARFAAARIARLTARVRPRVREAQAQDARLLSALQSFFRAGANTGSGAAPGMPIPSSGLKIVANVREVNLFPEKNLKL